MAKAQKPIKFTTTITKTTTDSGWHYLPVEGSIAAKLKFPDKFKRVVCTVNSGVTFQCALMPWGPKFYIIFNQEKRDSIGVGVGDVVNVELIRDESKYGLPMPEEFEEVLNQDADGDRMFHSLTAGKQRSLIYQVSQSKDIDRRIHFALTIIEHLKDNDGKVVNEKLFEELKRPAL